MSDVHVTQSTCMLHIFYALFVKIEAKTCLNQWQKLVMKGQIHLFHSQVGDLRRINIHKVLMYNI